MFRATKSFHQGVVLAAILSLIASGCSQVPKEQRPRVVSRDGKPISDATILYTDNPSPGIIIEQTQGRYDVREDAATIGGFVDFKAAHTDQRGEFSFAPLGGKQVMAVVLCDAGYALVSDSLSHLKRITIEPWNSLDLTVPNDLNPRDRLVEVAQVLLVGPNSAVTLRSAVPIADDNHVSVPKMFNGKARVTIDERSKNAALANMIIEEWTDWVVLEPGKHGPQAFNIGATVTGTVAGPLQDAPEVVSLQRDEIQAFSNFAAANKDYLQAQRVKQFELSSEYSAEANGTGEFKILHVPPGTYTLSILPQRTLPDGTPAGVYRLDVPKDVKVVRLRPLTNSPEEEEPDIGARLR